ncbi:NTP transferase domain-containing protein [Bacillus timonensis]|nr:NTP transferase domain-containing protein [Bacillus timonensis]
MDDQFKVLEVINKQSNLSQKKISELCDISSGKVNYIINEMITNGYLVTEKSGRNTNYFLTEAGVEFLKQGIETFQDKKVNIHTQSNKEIKQAVILTAGTQKDFDTPVSLLPIGETTLFQRNLDILKENGIEKFVVVTGYKKEAFNFLENIPNVHLVENKKYKWTGSMASLALAAEYITDDFLLVEHDVLTEENTFKRLIDHNQRDCALLTSESGSGDEAFVELRNGYLYKVSKDIHQFNRIDGEMVGLSKLSYEVFQKMIHEFKENKNPYLNYEYLLLDVARQYNIGYVKINDLVWAEIDTKEHYQHVINTVYPKLKRKEAEFKENQIKDFLTEALEIPREDILSVEPFGGLTNKNFKMVLSNEKEYVLRIPGNGTDKMINRFDEKVNSKLANSVGIDAPLIYINAETGVKISEIIENAETLNPKTAKREDNMILTSDILRKLHHSNLPMKNIFDISDKIEQYEEIMAEVNGQKYEGYDRVREQVMEIIRMYKKMDIDLLPCHNDALAENFVKSGEDKIYLIDWEYGGLNDPMWDLAAHSLECEFSQEDEELFLSLYFEGEEIPEEIHTRILIHKIFQDFLWSIWTILKEAKGDDFGTYGIDRFNRAIKNIEKLKIGERVL